MTAKILAVDMLFIKKLYNKVFYIKYLQINKKTLKKSKKKLDIS